jgi:Zn-dependent protease with chaperone function/uncharacterized RDD family membrane protein YckC
MFLLVPGYCFLVPAVCISPAILLFSFILLSHKTTLGISTYLVRFVFWGYAAFVLMSALFSALKNLVVPRHQRQDENYLYLCKNSEEVRLYEFITILADQLNAPRPRHIILHAKPELYVSTGHTCAANASIRGLTIVLGLPYVRLLSVGQLRSLLVHELSHFSGYDLFYPRFIRPLIYGLFSASLVTQRLASSWYSPKTKIQLLLLPIFSLWNQAVSIARLPNFLLNRYLNAWLLTTQEFLRLREIRADTIAAETCGRGTYSRALTKAVGIQKTFAEYLSDIAVEAIRSRSYPANIYKTFAVWYSSNMNTVCLYIQNELQKSTAINVHPPLYVRLQNIKEASCSDRITEGLRDSGSAIGLLTNLACIEESMADQLMLAQVLSLSNNASLPSNKGKTLVEKQSEVMWSYNPPITHFERRLYAFITDTLITAFSAFAIFVIVVKVQIIDSFATPLFCFVLFPYFYHSYFETSRLRSTPGKYLFHLRLAGVNGQSVTVLQSVARLTLRFGYALFFLITVPVNIVLLIRYYDYRMLYDMVVNTEVEEISSHHRYV